MHGLTSPIYVADSNQKLDLQRHMPLYFSMFFELGWEVIVPYVVVIVDCHLLNFLSTIVHSPIIHVLIYNGDVSVYLSKTNVIVESTIQVANWNVFKNECLPCRLGIFRGLSLSCSVYTCNSLLMELKICKQKFEIERYNTIILILSFVN